MQEELKIFRESSTQLDSNIDNPQNIIHKKAEQATSTFDRMLEKHAHLTGGGSIDAKNAGHMAELEQLARDNRIQERLAALKSGKS